MSKTIEALKKRSKYGLFTPRETLRDLYVSRNQTEVGKTLGVSQQTVSAMMQQLRVPARARRTATPKGFVAQELTRRGRTTRQTAYQMFINYYRTQGLSTQEIADVLGASPESVRRFASDRKIQLRRQGRPRGKTRTSSNRTFDLTGCL